ncbi:hypothetical protein [Ruegeria sp. TM1040]|jgi:hypothetical protein|uniref:hypothetical protein n=1 Tax=Rhodobacterales TaxID=204455 RepID=UPI000046275A|nr:hypothetical protein [Ruegeria sp. TM1040]ABF63779.1 hypothetical protein TM1040_1046 [Ruegeria sp. TM1040]MDF9302556.1 hypothetical protein [Tritonibacter mobilis]
MAMIDQNVIDFTRVAPIDHVPGFRTDAPSQVTLRPGGSVSALLLRLLGGGMVLASTGLWLMPESGADPQMALIRIGVSVFLLFAGLCLLLQRDVKLPPEFHFDAQRNELRIEEMRSDGRPVVLMRRSYASLGAARFDGKVLQILETDGRLLAELPLEGRATRKLLLAQLRPHLRIVS